MRREFSYETITLQNIEENEHLIFICNGDSKKVMIERVITNDQKKVI